MKVEFEVTCSCPSRDVTLQRGCRRMMGKREEQLGVVSITVGRESM